MKRPLVLALNPSIDAEWRVDVVRWEERCNVLSERRWAGGKGVNVARWLKHFGEKPHLILPLAGASGRELAAMLRAERIPISVIRLRRFPGRSRAGGGAPESATRVNVIITTNAQGQLRFNPRGPVISRCEWQLFQERVRIALHHASCLILSGSLPPGVPVNAYARLIRIARAAGVPALLDCDGHALAAAVRARPFLIKPNRHELIEWFGTARLQHGAVGGTRRLPGPAAASRLRSAAFALSQQTGGWIFVSQGPGPALLVNAATNQCLTAKPARVKSCNTVGAGDALLAAVAQQVIRGAPPAGWLRAGLNAGAAAVRLDAGCLPR